MPGQPGPRGAAANQRIGKDVVEIVDSVGLRGRRIFPAEPEFAHAPLHHARDITDLFRNALWADVPVAHRTFGIARVAFLRLSATCDHKTRRRALARPREGEGVERRL